MWRLADRLATARQYGGDNESSAVPLFERAESFANRILGPEHPDTLTARANLASSYRQAGRTNDAIKIEEQVVGDRERILGPEHPNTLTARANLASSYRQAGRSDGPWVDSAADSAGGIVTTERSRKLVLVLAPGCQTSVAPCPAGLNTCTHKSRIERATGWLTSFTTKANCFWYALAVGLTNQIPCSSL